MAKRHTGNPDSLELLLDTICNTFGGVLFIAILVVLLLQQAGNSPVSATPAPVAITPIEAETLSERMEMAIDELARLRLNQDSQEAVVQSFAPDAIKQLLTDRRTATSAQQALQSDVDRLLANNTLTSVRVENTVHEIGEMKERHAEALQRNTTAQHELEESRQSRVQEARLPVLRKPGLKSEVGFILRYGRLYLWHRYGPGDYPDRRGLNLEDFVVVGEEQGRLVTAPNPTRGLELDDSENCQQAVRSVLRRFNPQNCYFVLIVRPDSYGQFGFVRDRIIELGFEYRLFVVGESDPIQDHGGRGGSVQ